MKSYIEFLKEDTGTASLSGGFNPVLGTIQKRKSLTEEECIVNIVYTDNIRTMNRWTIEDSQGNKITGDNGYSVHFRTKEAAEEYANSNGFTIGDYKHIDWTDNENI